MRFTQHYAGNAVCAPSRGVLLTGRHPGHAAIRDNRELQPEGQWPLPGPELTIAEVLKPLGYATGAMGKWGLGPPGSEGDPLKQGFDHFFGYNCQRQAHGYYPSYLYDDGRRVVLGNPESSPHQRLAAGADPLDPGSYAAFSGNVYAPDVIWARGRDFIRVNRSRPFFVFLPTTLPHLALQVPEDSLVALPRPLRRNAVPRRQGVPAAPDAAGGIRRDGDAPRPRGRADPRPARRAGARGAHDRRLHLGQRSPPSTPAAPTPPSSVRRALSVASRARSTRAACACRRS
jgi:hypothetical protein